jgi:prepilin-type N-terminal cleavage/methylation domain-containing protein
MLLCGQKLRGEKMIQNKRGFTLVELIVSLSILTFVVAALYSVFSLSNKSWAVFSTNIVLQHNAREGMIAMSRELRQSHDFLVVKEEGGLKMNFIRPPMGLVTYSWTTEGADAFKIIRKNNGKTDVLANDITAFTLDYLSNAVLIDMTASTVTPTGESNKFSLKQKVAVRSKVYEDKQ